MSVVIVLGRLFAHENRPKEVFTPYGYVLADVDEEPPDFLLEDHNECQRPYADETTENFGEQVHVKLLDEQEDDIDESQADEDINGNGTPYQAVDIVKDDRHQKDVDDVKQPEVKVEALQVHTFAI